MAKQKSQHSQTSYRFLRVLKSRQMVIAVSTLIVGLLVLVVPDLKPIREELLTLIITLALAVIGRYTVQDTASSERQKPIPREELRELVEEVLSDMVEEVRPSEEKVEETTQHDEKHPTPF
jgi:hypothetical protein